MSNTKRTKRKESRYQKDKRNTKKKNIKRKISRYQNKMARKRKKRKRITTPVKTIIITKDIQIA